MRSCELDYREQRSKRAHSPGFQTPGFVKDYEIFEGPVVMKRRIQMLVLHNYQRILNDFVWTEKKATQWDPPFPVGSMFET